HRRIRPPGSRLHGAARRREPDATAREGEDERRPVRAVRRVGRHDAELPVLQHLMDRRREEAHGVSISRATAGGRTSIAVVHTAWQRMLARTPFVQSARPAQTAPPTAAPATKGRLPLAAFAMT